MAEIPIKVPALLIISGLPATGKSTLAKRLAEHFNLPLIGKDHIKETLYDVLGYTDLAQSKRLGQASMMLLFRFAEAVLRTGQPCIIESTFHHEFSTPDLLNLKQRCPFVPLEILCVTEGPVLAERWKRRRASGERHPGHLEHLLGDDIVMPGKQEQSRPLDLGGHVITLDTTNFEDIDYKKIFEEMKRVMDTSFVNACKSRRLLS